MIDPEFNPAAIILTAAIVALVAAGVITGKSRFNALALARTYDPEALLRYARSRFLLCWGLVAGAGLVVLAAPGIDPADLGLVLPHGAGGRTATAIGAGYLVALALAVAQFRRNRQRQPDYAAASPLVPRTTAEGSAMTAASITAGVWEEVVFRGLLIAAAVGLFHLPVTAAAAVSVLLFGLGHSYQGWAGIVGTTVVGSGLTLLYLMSGSLLVPIVVHALHDVALLVLIPAGQQRRQPL